LLKPGRLRADFLAVCFLTASVPRVFARSTPIVNLEDTMRTSLVTVLAIGATVLLALPALAGPAQSPAPAGQTAASPAKPAINLNTATIEQLETLPGIGRKTAELIMEYRTKSGGFKRIEDLMNVKGIGEKSFLKLKPLVTTAKAPGD
jgi:competence protein ComEA